MTRLLTRAEYAAIAAGLAYPTEPFIDGVYRPALSGRRMDTINPATGKVLAQIHACGPEDVDLAVRKAREAFEGGAWSRLPPAERKAVMLRMATLLEDHLHELAVLESLESGKPVGECQLTDVPDALKTLRWHGEAADKIYDQIAPTGADSIGMIVREPVGVVGCVLPWNFPLGMAAWKIGPALATGNSVVVKPAEQTSMTTLRLAELAHEAGVPAGVLNVLPGFGPDVGEPIGRHADVGVVSFTGSTEVGRKFLEFAAQSNLKNVILECGGKSPAVVLSDAEDLDRVAEHVVNGALWNMGQNCTANSRIIVHRDVKGALLPKILKELENWSTGDPLDPRNRLGAIVSREQYDKILGYIRSGIDDGAELIRGGHAMPGDGLFIEPTLFDHVTPDMAIAREEIFGPVFGIITVDSDAEAVAVANDTCYGLQASLYTSSLKKANRYSRALRAGMISVNCYGEGDITTPFGGYKSSGFGGRDNSLLAHDQYVETKTIWMDISDAG